MSIGCLFNTNVIVVVVAVVVFVAVVVVVVVAIKNLHSYFNICGESGRGNLKATNLGNEIISCDIL